MHVRLNWLRLALPLCLFAFGARSADATSLGKAGAPSPTACHVSAKFMAAKPVDGKIAWTFRQLPGNSAAQCAALPQTFQVLIPSGSYSTLSHANVYPVSMREPSAGDTLDLRIENYGAMGWLFAADADALKAVQ